MKVIIAPGRNRRPGHKCYALTAVAESLGPRRVETQADRLIESLVELTDPELKAIPESARELEVLELHMLILGKRFEQLRFGRDEVIKCASFLLEELQEEHREKEFTGWKLVFSRLLQSISGNQ